MKLNFFLIFWKLIHGQYLKPFPNHKPDPDPGETVRLIGELIKYYQNNKNFDAKATPESSYQVSRYVFPYSHLNF